jgi:hypothetical protein
LSSGSLDKKGGEVREIGSADFLDLEVFTVTDASCKDRLAQAGG